MLKRLIESHLSHPEYTHTVISLTDLGKIGQELQWMGIKVTALGMRNALDLPSTYSLLRRELSANRPDIAQTWMYHADLLGGLAARAAGVNNIIWGVRTTEIKSGGSRITRLIRKSCALLSHFIPTKIVCAANAAQKVHEDVGYVARKMQVIPNGFDIDKLVASPAQRDSVRTQAGFSAEHTVIGSVGRFNAVKDQKNFVEAAGLLAMRNANLRFLMVGRDLTPDNTQLMQWITETGAPECFTLLGERSDVPACLAAMDIFCLHSRTEGFPNVVGEAMAMGKPCVVTNVGDAAFLVDNTGIVVSKEDPAALAEGIEKLLSLSPLELNTLGRSAQQRIHSRFTMNHSRQQFEKLYQETSTVA